jgi:hypothetical protein
MSKPYAVVARRTLVVAFSVLGSALLVGAAAPSEPMSAGAATPSEPASAPVAATPSEATPVDAGRCFPACVSCEQRCPRSGRERDNCMDNCHDANATCCEANGKQPNYKMCACH